MTAEKVKMESYLKYLDYNWEMLFKEIYFQCMSAP